MENSLTFLKQCRIKRFAKGELILVQDEVPSTAYFIKKGVVKTYNLTQLGDEKPISFDIKDEIFPVAWVFSKLPYVQYFYEAFTDCELYCVPKEVYIDFLRNHPAELFEVFEHFIGRYMNYQMRINALEQSKASSKVVSTIHLLSLRFGKDQKKNVVKIQLPMTQQDLANFMGLTRETTSMELKKLHEAGVITYKNQNYSVNTDKLDKLLDEDYGQGRLSA